MYRREQLLFPMIAWNLGMILFETYDYQVLCIVRIASGPTGPPVRRLQISLASVELAQRQAEKDLYGDKQHKQSEKGGNQGC